MLELRVCIIGCVCVPLIGGGEATLTHPNERGLGCERGNPWKILPTSSLSFLQDKKMTGETPEVRSDKRKPREKKEKRERKRENTKEKEREERKRRKRKKKR